MEPSKEQADFARFLAQIGHEIRTPLNAIKGFGDLLAEEQVGPLNSVQRKYLQKMTDSAQKLLLVVNQILDWAKLESNQIVLEAQPVDLCRLAQEVGALLELRLQEKNLIYRASVTDNMLTVGDRDRLREVLINLVSNSIKFTEAGGEIEVSFAKTEQTVIVHVRDSGCGMDDAQLEQLFHPFCQGVNRPGEEKSSGLGLWICRSIVELHGGRIWAESVPGVGTTFSFALPTVEMAKTDETINSVSKK